MFGMMERRTFPDPIMGEEDRGAPLLLLLALLTRAALKAARSTDSASGGAALAFVGDERMRPLSAAVEDAALISASRRLSWRLPLMGPWERAAAKGHAAVRDSKMMCSFGQEKVMMLLYEYEQMESLTIKID